MFQQVEQETKWSREESRRKYLYRKREREGYLGGIRREGGKGDMREVDEGRGWVKEKRGDGTRVC